MYILYYDIVLCAAAAARVHVCTLSSGRSLSLCVSISRSPVHSVFSSPPPYLRFLPPMCICYAARWTVRLSSFSALSQLVCVVCRLTSYWNIRRDIIIFTCCLYGDNRVAYVYILVYCTHWQTSLCLLSPTRCCTTRESLRLRLLHFRPLF